MTEYEDKRILSFFEEYARKEIADDGFSQRVMRSLPSHDYVYKQRLNRIWTAMCALAAVVLFVRADGFAVLKGIAADFVVDAFTSTMSIDVSGVSLLMVVMTLLTFVYVAIYNILTSDN